MRKELAEVRREMSALPKVGDWFDDSSFLYCVAHVSGQPVWASCVAEPSKVFPVPDYDKWKAEAVRRLRKLE